MQVLQRADVVADDRLPGLDAAVALVHIAETQHLSGVFRVRNVEPDIVVKRLLVALQRQDVVASGLRDPLRRVPLRVHRVGGQPSTCRRIRPCFRATTRTTLPVL